MNLSAQSSQDSTLVKISDLDILINVAQTAQSCDSLINDYDLTVKSAGNLISALDSVVLRQGAIIKNTDSQRIEWKARFENSQVEVKQEKKKLNKWRTIGWGAIFIATIELYGLITN